jgi:hypothetical protein
MSVYSHFALSFSFKKGGRVHSTEKR